MSHEVITFGCRLNSYESEVIKQAIDTAGNQGGVQTIVFNSCAVTQEAERQLRQAIRKARRNNPEARIVVTGCAAQIAPEKYAKMQEVDVVLGNEEKLKPESYQFSHQAPESTEVHVQDIMTVKETASHLISGFDGRARAFVQVQTGCNHRCTFCIIPYGRGNNRAVPIGEIVGQVKQLVANGYKEVVLTGVDITDYGKDLPGQPTFGQMVRRLLKLVPELPRLRLSSVDVAEIDDDLMALIATEPRLMPHLHISVQSGDNMILKRMKRRHTREQVITFCDKVRKLRPEVVFGADIIVGFPTETEEMFQNTLNLVEEAGLTYLHVFPYSEREGTPAARMPQLPKDIRKERAARLREAGNIAHKTFLERKVGCDENVIVEEEKQGRGEDFSIIRLEQVAVPGDIVKVRIRSQRGEYLIGEPII